MKGNGSINYLWIALLVYVLWLWFNRPFPIEPCPKDYNVALFFCRREK